MMNSDHDEDTKECEVFSFDRFKMTEVEQVVT